MRKRLNPATFHRRRQQLNQQRRSVIMRRWRIQQRRQLSQWLMFQSSGADKNVPNQPVNDFQTIANEPTNG